MIHRYSFCVPWIRTTVIASVASLVLVLLGCEQNPALPLSPSQPWSFKSIIIDDFAVAPLTRTPSHGNSLTLYAGVIADPEFREAGILIKVSNSSLDSTLLANLEAAHLILIRRTFGADTLPKPAVLFTLSVIETAETLWTEVDTGLTIVTDFPDEVLTPKGDSTMVQDSVQVFTGVTVASMAKQYREHLVLRVNPQVLSDWRTEGLTNNGFLIQVSGEEELVGFHSREALSAPYLAIAFHDTTSTGADTVKTRYLRMQADMSVYHTPVQDFPSDQPFIQLNHSKGLGVFIDSLTIVTNNPIVGGRLILHTQADAPQLVADQMKIDLLWHTDSLGVGDRMASAVFQAGSDSLIMNVGAVVLRYVNGFDLYGLELVVDPQHNDFDNLSFWGSDADKLLRPRLEIISSFPYGEEVE
ncbi:MAG: hypothetical protein IID14_02340 [Candidatus Marinimicrobia bacterium]|nr:hypothetical protein [Candidatus Neomarinimicrobiota bacterium]